MSTLVFLMQYTCCSHSVTADLAIKTTTSWLRKMTPCESEGNIGSSRSLSGRNKKMASKSRVKLSRNTGASANTQAVSPRRNTCGICRKAVVDGKDDALFCEGHCQRWLHRVCASVTEEQHDKLAASEQPFLCPACCQADNLQQIAKLTSMVDALKLELEQLKQVVQKQMEKQPHFQRTVPNVSMQASSIFIDGMEESQTNSQCWLWQLYSPQCSQTSRQW